MISTAILRRYGHGVARLPVGIPVDRSSLTQQSRERTRAELSFALSPTVICVVLAWLLAAASILGRTTEREALAPIPISLALWTEAPSPPAEPATTAVPPPAPEPEPEALAASAPVAPVAPSAEPFDPLQLLLPPSASAPGDEPGSLGTPAIASRPMPARPERRPVPDLVAGWSVAEGPPSVPVEPSSTAASRSEQLIRTSRPRARQDFAPEQAVGGWSVDQERRAFLAGLRAEPTKQAISDPTERERPPVAAAHSIDAERTLLAEARRVARAQGWQEVPLGSLPDCSPPGRQDLLKQQILRTSVGRPECASPAGHFRFLETRNLNAFLMWSRSQSADPVTHRPDRDACGVLERALRCLGAPPLEEH